MDLLQTIDNTNKNFRRNLRKILSFAQDTSFARFIVKPITKAISKKVDEMLIAPNLQANFMLMENHLAKNSYFAGKTISGADIQMCFVVEAGEKQLGYRKFPNLQKYISKIRERSSYQNALKLGGKILPD